MAVTPETAALTKFRSSPKDYVKVTFYNRKEWKELWASRTSAADAFMNEYKELNAEKQREKWVGHETVYKEMANSDIEKELSKWSSSKSAEHYFVKEIEVGISSLPEDFPKQVVFVDTPGLSDPVAYRSEITREYIRRANAVFVCVDAQKLQKEEIETISSVFSFSSHNKGKVHIIATHWDKMNNPKKDWEEQKLWMEKRLVGTGFFETKEMAETNIMHSAAYIFNLCRDYKSLEQSERFPLMQFMLSMGLIDFGNIEGNLPGIMELTNIQKIKEVVTDRLAKNYQELLNQDIERKYLEIVYDLKRIAKENMKEIEGIIEISYADKQKMERKVEEQKKRYEKVMGNKAQLEKVLRIVEERTQKRLDVILNVVNKKVNGL